jgi:hypothetical protein
MALEVVLVLVQRVEPELKQEEVAALYLVNCHNCNSLL